MGIIIGFQISNWSENRSNANNYNHAIERHKAETRINLDYLDNAETNFLPFFEAVPETIDILLQCEDSPENLKKVNLGISRVRGSWGLKIRTEALEELRTDPILLSYQTAEMKEKLSSLASKLELLHVEANFVELAPFDTPIEFNPILKLGQLQSVGANIDYNGVDFSRKNRSLYLSVPISEACENDQLIKSLYIWEKWQRVIPVIIRNMRIELEQSLKYLE